MEVWEAGNGVYLFPFFISLKIPLGLQGEGSLLE